MRALVTGASGFIGANLCDALVRDGAEVHGVSRREGLARDVRWHRVDLVDSAAVDELVRQVSPDVVFHLASHVSGALELAQVRVAFEANLASAVALLEAAARHECGRVVLAGSYKELLIGNRRHGTPYAAAKYAATGYGQMFHAAYGLSVVNLRLFMVYGPGQWDTTKVVPYTTLALLAGAAPALSSGASTYDWVYVGDVVDALRLAGGPRGAEGDGEAIEIGSGESTSVAGIVDELARRTDAVELVHFGARADAPAEPLLVASLERAHTVLGWQPRTSLAAGLDSTVAWFRVNAGRLAVDLPTS